MNTKTMRLPPRRVVTSSNNKRKEREESEPQPTTAQSGSAKPLKPNTPTNHLLAGYLAHEFLTKGTLLGKPWEPVRAEPSSQPKWAKPNQKPDSSGKSKDENYRRYTEVSSLIRANGAHVPGIVNPAQLARFLQL